MQAISKRAQLDNPIIFIAVIIIGLLIIAPVMLKVMREIRTPLSNSLGNISSGSGAIAQSNFNSVIDTGISWWDKVVVAAFILSVLLLFVSAFLVDAHPFFIIVYIGLNFALILFAPNIIEAVNKIYDSSQFAQETAILSFMDTIRSNYVGFLIGLMVITGIIIYGKVAITGSGRDRGRY